MKNKEYGSDFHYISDWSFRSVGREENTFSSIAHLYYSGRAALHAIIENGITQYAWKKIYVPSYYCQEVYDFIRPLNIQIEYYQYHPFSKNLDFLFEDEEGHVLLVVNYFGIDILDIGLYKHLVVIEDLTHDLSAIDNSRADYVFGSLRKVLPLPVGGFAKAMNQHQLPLPSKSFAAEEAALKKWTAMYLKRRYLETGQDVKSLFRSLFMSGEETFDKEWTNVELPAIVKPYLYSLNIEQIVKTKRENAEIITQQIRQNDLFDVISSSVFNQFGCILRFQSGKTRDLLKKYLIERAIYPFILWPNQITQMDKAIADSLLFLHIDFRYDNRDMNYLAETINNFSSHA